MKISIIGAGNVGGMTAAYLAQQGAGEIVLIDAAAGFAQGKSYDLEDASCVLKYPCKIEGSSDISKIKDSNVIVVTAGLARKPGMTREDLLYKNSQILKEISLNIKNLASESIVIIVTNPLDLMTYFALKITGFPPSRVFGMGLGLDAARFCNLISKELSVPNDVIDACVIGSHGEGMLPLARFTRVNNKPLSELVSQEKALDLAAKTIGRGAQIVSLLGSGSAYFAPAQAICELISAIIKDEQRVIGVSAYLSGEYEVSELCIGVPCRIGRQGIKEIVELELNNLEAQDFLKSASSIKEQIKNLPKSDE